MEYTIAENCFQKAVDEFNGGVWNGHGRCGGGFSRSSWPTSGWIFRESCVGDQSYLRYLPFVYIVMWKYSYD
jgi:hypothetical protein